MSTQQLFLFDTGIDLQQLRSLCEEYMVETKSRNTEVAYQHAWKVFCDWCVRAGRTSLPATGDTVALHVAWLARERGLNVKTIRVKLAGIAHRHMASGHPTPVTRDVGLLVKTIARKQRRKPRKKRAVSEDVLARVAGLDLAGGPKDVRDRTLLLFGFALSWRRSEIASLDLEDVEFKRKLIVRLGASKTDQEGRGRTVKLAPGKSPLTCPVRALKQWIQVRGDWAGPLFCSVNTAGTRIEGDRISGQVICKGVQRLLALAGEEEKRYGAHSLRSGMITTAAEHGADIVAIQQRTGHRSLDTLVDYIQTVDGFGRDPLAGVL